MWQHCNRAELEALATLYEAALQVSPHADRTEGDLRVLIRDYSHELHRRNAERLAAEPPPQRPAPFQDPLNGYEGHLA